MRTSQITNMQDVIDSRDVIARIAELEETDRDEFDTDELEGLRKLASEGEGVADWTYGVALINDSYFEDYAREFAEDIGAVNPDAGWPASYIDWEAAADALRMDYTSIDFDGVTYWAR